MKNLADEVRYLINVGSWRQVFTITDRAYHELTLEVLVTFEKEWGQVTWDKADAISFQLHKRPYHMSYTEFTLHISWYNEDYTRTRTMGTSISIGRQGNHKIIVGNCSALTTWTTIHIVPKHPPSYLLRFDLYMHFSVGQ